MKTNSRQIRIRLPGEEAVRYLALPPRERSIAVAMILRSVDGIDLKTLVVMRNELVNLGTLINQSLRVSQGKSVNEIALTDAVKLLKTLTRNEP
jgi:hypothetical protein